MNNPKIAGAIIAGGRSSRYGETNKADAMLGGNTLLEHVYQRLSSQVRETYINTQQDYAGLKNIPEPIQVADAVKSQKGTLNGVLGGLVQAEKNGFEWLLIAPCDTPFLPLNLAKVLNEAANAHNWQLCIPRANGMPQASLSLWHTSLLEPLTHAVVNGKLEGFKQFYPQTRFGLVDWPLGDYDPFLNINYRSDLNDAARILNQLD